MSAISRHPAQVNSGIMAVRYLVLVTGTFGKRGGTFREIGAVWRRSRGTQMVRELIMDLQATGDVAIHENGRFCVVDLLNHVYTEDGLGVVKECDPLQITDLNLDDFYLD